MSKFDDFVDGLKSSDAEFFDKLGIPDKKLKRVARYFLRQVGAQIKSVGVDSPVEIPALGTFRQRVIQSGEGGESTRIIFRPK